ncbi:hypothetical protein [Deinococcus yunweiensis]|uniref:hypothetical protein n=1 Tax=Deinococcus yunweiensis TaxID=367282 RepID=UPI00398E6285
MRVREVVTAIVAYGLVALLSALVVSGGNLGNLVQALSPSTAPELAQVVQPPTAVAGVRVPAAPDTSSADTSTPAAPASAPGQFGDRDRPAAPLGLPPTIPAIPGADAGHPDTGRPEADSAASMPAAAAPTRRTLTSSETGSAELDASLQLARWLTQQWYDGTLEPVWASFAPAVKAQWGSYSQFRTFRAGGQRAYGSETAVLREALTPSGDLTYYTRTASFERGPKDGWTLIIGLDAGGQVREFGVVGAALLPARMRNLMQ